MRRRPASTQTLAPRKRDTVRAASPAAADSSALFEPDLLRRFRRSLRAWYTRHARDLPWRRTADPYQIWISEIMLQQTTVTAVVPYFERFLERFPTVTALASADEQEVLRYWEGLGYYSRARNIHKTARLIVAEQGGNFPSEVEQLIGLPGIGRYTAGAIASFAFDRRAPIVEANTLRLYSRLLALQHDPRTRTSQETLWQFAEHVLPRQEPGRFNQALMELGARLCTPIDPRCVDCPVRSCCAAHAGNLQQSIPLRARRPEPTKVIDVALAVRRNQSYLLYRRPPGERWAGLWDFPRFSWGTEPDRDIPISTLAAWAERELATRLGIRTDSAALIEEIRHSVTRYQIRLLCFAVDYLSGKVQLAEGEYDWVKPGSFQSHPLSVTGRKLAERIIQTHAAAEP